MKKKPFILSAILFSIIMLGFVFWKMQKPEPIRQENKHESVVTTVQATQEQKSKRIIYGTVYKNNKMPVQSAMISWSLNNQKESIQCKENGYYEFMLPESIDSQLQFSISKQGYRKWISSVDINELSFPFKQDIELTNDGLLSGTVINKENGLPISDCSVKLCVDYQISSFQDYLDLKETRIPELFTDNKGYFYLDLSKYSNLKHSYQILFKADGYKSHLLKINYLKESHLQIELIPGKDQLLSGYTVQNDTKKPLPHVRITIFSRLRFNDLTIAETISNESGMFSVYLPEGRYTLIGTKNGYKVIDPYFSILPDSRTQNEPLYLELSNTYQISGYVLEAGTEQPIVGVTLAATGGFNSYFEYPHTITDENGFYSFQNFMGTEFSPGCTDHSYFYANNLAPNISLNQDYLNGFNISNFNIYLEKGVAISGTVRNNKGEAIENAIIISYEPNPIECYSNPDGTYKFYTNRNTRCSLNVQARGYQENDLPSVLTKENDINNHEALRCFMWVATFYLALLR